jgi:twitching motility protein PilT
MAVIDSLLGLVESQRARGLVIAPDRAPELLLAEGRRALSMPPIAARVVEGFAREVGGGGHYETAGGQAFAVRVEGAGATLRLTFSRAGEPEAAAPEAGPGAAAGSDEAIDARLLDLLGRLARDGATDLLLSSGLPPRLRAGGALRTLEGPVLDDAAILALLEPALHPQARRQLESIGSADLAIELPGADDAPRFRVNLFRQLRGLAAALRPIRSDPPTLAELNLPESLGELVAFQNGLVLLVGPAGCGKSTTLVALVERLNRSAARHVVTLEDPIEYRYPPARCLIHQREVGRHVDGFAGGLRAALREAPDVIVVGEMRDRETIAAALTAAETGHLVLSTLHSANPWMAIDRVIDGFPGDHQRQVRAQLALVLRAVVAQHLLPSTSPPLRVPACEKLMVTAAAANQIRDDKVHQLQSTIQSGRDEGMLSLEASLAGLVRAHQVELTQAQAHARDVQLLTELLAKDSAR